MVKTEAPAYAKAAGNKLLPSPSAGAPLLDSTAASGNDLRRRWRHAFARAVAARGRGSCPRPAPCTTRPGRFADSREGGKPADRRREPAIVPRVACSCRWAVCVRPPTRPDPSLPVRCTVGGQPGAGSLAPAAWCAGTHPPTFAAAATPRRRVPAARPSAGSNPQRDRSALSCPPSHG